MHHGINNQRHAYFYMWDHHLNVSQLPFPSSQYCLVRAILYFLQYMQSFPPIVCLFNLMQLYISYLFISNIQQGLSIYLWYPILHQHMTKFPVVNLKLIIFCN